MYWALVFLLSAGTALAQQYTIHTLAGGVPPVTPARAIESSIGDPPRVAVDEAGNIYFASIYSIFKVDRSGTLTRMAGAGRRGLSGDGGPALSAQLLSPVGLAVDAAGNIYFSEREAHLIRKISAAGIISRYAGSGARGSFGDGGPALDAAFDGPMGLAVDTAGNLYVADENNHVVRRITPAGIIDTVAGNGRQGYSGDGARARDAHLNGPEGVAVDAAGNLYIADTFNYRIRIVDAAGVIDTFAANGHYGYGGDGGPAVNATVHLPTDVAVDRNGTLYIADLGNSRIRKVSNGTMATLAGSDVGPQAIGVVGQPAASVRLNGPTGVAVDAAGNVFFAEGSIGSGSGLTVGDNKVWRVSTDGILTAVAGNGYRSYSGDFAAAARAQLNAPAGMAIDNAGNLYFADSLNHRVRRISPGGTVETVAGNGIPGFSGDAGHALQAELNNPQGVALDNAGNLYIVDTGNNRIRRVTPSGAIGTVAGNGNAAFFGDGTRAIAAAIRAPSAVAVDGDGNLYIADTLNHRIRRVNGSGIIDTIVGRTAGFSGDGGPAIQALLSNPASIALDAAGNLYIADTGNGRIRKVLAGTHIISTIAAGEGTSRPRAVTLDVAGNVYFSDAAQNRVSRIATDGTVAVVAGEGTCCYSGDGGAAASARLNAPWGAASDPAGNVYVADSGNNAIRVLFAGSSGLYIRTVVNGASNLLGGLAPGEIVAIHGAGLGPAELVTAKSAVGLYPTELAGTVVTFNGIAAPLLYTSAGQISAVVPYGVTGFLVRVAVQYRGAATAEFTLPLAEAAPAWFTADSSGAGPVLAFTPDWQRVSPENPAAPGSLVTLYATGEGATAPDGVDGKVAEAPLPRPKLPVAVWINGVAASVEYAGGAAGAIAGTMQVNVRIPAGMTAGSVPIVLQVGDRFSPVGITIAVR